MGRRRSSSKTDGSPAVIEVDSRTSKRFYVATVGVIKTTSGGNDWIHAALWVDDNEEAGLRTSRTHDHEQRTYWIVHEGEIPAGTTPTFRADFVRQHDYDDAIGGKIELTIIIYNRPE